MTNTTMTWMAAGALAASLGILLAGVPSVHAQSTLGGPKTQQSKIGGVAKPAPAIGGAPSHPNFVAPKPGPTTAIAKPVMPGGTTTPGTTGANTPSPAAGNAHQNPPPTQAKGPSVATNLKCASGACMTRGPKP